MLVSAQKSFLFGGRMIPEPVAQACASTAKKACDAPPQGARIRCQNHGARRNNVPAGGLLGGEGRGNGALGGGSSGGDLLGQKGDTTVGSGGQTDGLEHRG